MKRAFVFLAVLLLPTLAAGQAPTGLPNTWVVRSQTTKVENFRGQKALRMRSGQAYQTDVQLEDGVIEFDIALTPYPSYVGVIFRVQSEREQEMIYFRPQKSKQWDAIQYAPHLHGETTWQLYPDYNAEAVLPTEGWMHVKLVVAGTRAALYLNGATKPAMIMPLQREPKPGYVGFTSGARPDVAEGIIVGNFANLEVQPGPAQVDAPKPGACETDARLLKQWRLSAAFPKAEATPEHALSDDFQKRLEWKTVGCDTNGVVNLTRHLGSPGENGAAALAEVELWSEREQVKKLGFGYSDDVTIFLNGQPLYSGVNGYSSRYPLYLGGVTPEFDAVYLPLRKGANKLLLVVSEEWGGWGFAARLEDLEGIQLR